MCSGDKVNSCTAWKLKTGKSGSSSSKVVILQMQSVPRLGQNAVSQRLPVPHHSPCQDTAPGLTWEVAVGGDTSGCSMSGALWKIKASLWPSVRRRSPLPQKCIHHTQPRLGGGTVHKPIRESAPGE